MDKQVVALFIPILALLIPVSAIVLHGMAKIAQAKAKQAPSGEVLDRLEAVEEEMAVLRGQLTETQERLDFAERLLARGKEEAPRH